MNGSDSRSLQRNPALAGFFVAAVLILSGCATPQVSQIARDFPISTVGTAVTMGIPVSASVPGVPFFPQDDFQCGPAALAMVAQHAGI